MGKCKNNRTEIIVECECGTCGREFKVNVKKSTPPWNIECPCCDSRLVIIRKINGN